MAILIQRNLPFKLLDCTKDSVGCYVIVRGVLYGEEIAVMNIYNPPGYPSNLLTKSFSKVIDLNIRKTLLGEMLFSLLSTFLVYLLTRKHLSKLLYLRRKFLMLLKGYNLAKLRV